MRTKPFPGWPAYDERELAALEEVVRSGKWWRGAYFSGELSIKGTAESRVTQLEERFAKHHGARFGIATSTGSAALNISVRAAGIGPGDEVIVPAYTFIATATCVLAANAVPIFVDIKPDTYCLDPAKVEEAITDKTRAIVPVHFAGQPADMSSLMAIAREHDLAVIEDCAHAHGAKWKDKMVGSIGQLGIFSFQQSKNMTAGEGGIVITNDEELAALCYSYHMCGRIDGRPWYEHYRLGDNYRLTEFQAAILLIQLDRLESQGRVRAENARYLSESLAAIEGVEPLVVDPRCSAHAFHIYVVRYNREEFGGLRKARFVELLRAEGIPCSTGYDLPLYRNPVFTQQVFYKQGCPLKCPNYTRLLDYRDFSSTREVTERACNEEAVWFPHRLLLGTKQDMADIAEAIAKVKDSIRTSSQLIQQYFG